MMKKNERPGQERICSMSWVLFVNRTVE
jgi:hypothetical protein